jgi:hypothetical protein
VDPEVKAQRALRRHFTSAVVARKGFAQRS